MVARAAGTDPDGQQALAELCKVYWYPVYAYVRRRGLTPEDAQDLTQDFFAHLLEGTFLQKVTPEMGRFRGYLFRSVKHFLATRRRRDAAQKRGGGQIVVSLEVEPEVRYRSDLAIEQTPEMAYDRNWAMAVLARVMERLSNEFKEAGRDAHFDKLHPYLAGTGGLPPYEEIAAALDMNPGTVAVSVHRMRRRFAALLRDEIARTVDRLDEVDEEIRHLRRVLGKGSNDGID